MILLITLLVMLAIVPAMFGQSQTQQPNPVDPTAQSPASPGPPPQSTPPTFPSGQASPDSQSSASSSTGSDAARTFMGTIVRSKDGYALRAGDVEYKLDDQSKAKEYVGKDVKVLGSLDKGNNTIRVQAIENQPTM